MKGLSEYDLWKGVDCRYNHLIKSNHKILAQAVATAITNGEPIDLENQKWVTGVLDHSTIEDKDFIEKELDANELKKRKEYLSKNFTKPWAHRAGLFDYFKKKSV